VEEVVKGHRLQTMGRRRAQMDSEEWGEWA
jgi:hypothetical protein